MRTDFLKAEFEAKFGTYPQGRLFFAPGRVNLIGEHTDYNGGHVFPCALDIGTYGVARKRDDKSCRLYSMNFPETGIIEVDISAIEQSDEYKWANYPLGVLKTFMCDLDKVQGVSNATPVSDITGFDLLLYGNIPNGSGLSSSASVEVLTGFIIKTLFDVEVDNKDLSLIGQYSENHFNGVNCGIMDQFAIAMGKKDHAIFLDTATLKYEYAPLDLGDATLVIGCTNKQRGLADSAYNERSSECEKALQYLEATSLGALTPEQFENLKERIPDEILIKRARHAVCENDRTMRALNSLKQGDIAAFGNLMNESHISLRDDYEVTGAELDAIVEAAWQQPGVLGARMTGAGFGGCSINLVEKDAVEAFIENVGKIYREKIGYMADFYVVNAGDGPREIED